jgi:hypothetical protein
MAIWTQPNEKSSGNSVQFGREIFWEELPGRLPPGLNLERLGTVIVPRRGPGGATIHDVAALESPQGRVQLLVEYRPHLLARDVPDIQQRLQNVLEQQRRRDAAIGGDFHPTSLPVVGTDLASQAVRDACLAAGLGLIDRSGTVLLRGPSLFLHVQGATRVSRTPRVNPFSGRGTRIIRLLLARPTDIWTARTMASASETSYVFSHGVLSVLERDGFLRRPGIRGGLQLLDGVGLLKRWSEADQAPALVVERFNAPSTETSALQAAAEALSRRGIRSIFTLASGLLPQEVFSAALPHGLYASGDFSAAENALGLRRITPYNFLLLRPHPAVDTDAGGIYCAPRALPHGQGVSVPQLVLDFQHVAGRGPEQARQLLEQLAHELPYVEGAE